MTTEDFIVELFVRVDEKMAGVPKHPQANLWPGEVVTLALLFAIKGVGERAFYRWLRRDWLGLFPRLPDRTRLFRLFATHRVWTARFLAGPTFFGVADTYGIELIHPIREGRSPRQIGKKGKSNRRWIVGVKLAVVLNRQGLVAAWDCATANVSDTEFRPLVSRFDGAMIVLTDRHRVPRQRGPRRGPAEHEGVRAEDVGRADGGRDGAVDAHRRLAPEEGRAPRLAVRGRPARVHRRGVQRHGPVARAGTRRGRQLPPVHRRVQPVTLAQKLAPFVI
jgi:hypothetical protein